MTQSHSSSLSSSQPEEIKELSITVGLLGANHEITKLIGESLGSPGTKSDMQFFNRLDDKLHAVFTAVSPIGYPDKVKTLIQTCAETQIHIMVIDAETGITAEIGEIMVVMDLFARYYGTQTLVVIGGITSSNEWRIPEIQKHLPQLVKNTALKGIPIYPLQSREDFTTLKGQIYTLASQNTSQESESPESPLAYSKVLIDHAFPVKGVGCVVLGLVAHGEIHAGQMYDLMPTQPKVILRSIQKFDRNFKTASVGDRVGLALKGVRAETIDRNSIFCSLGSMTVSDSFQAKIEVSPYYKGTISPKEKKAFHLIADLGISAIKLKSGVDIAPGHSGVIELELEKPLVHDAQGVRGIIADFGPFENKLRIVGYLEQLLE
jgi:selenocysteine-specific elongation factor